MEGAQLDLDRAPWTTALVGVITAAYAAAAAAGVALGIADPWTAWVGPRDDELLVLAGGRYLPLVPTEPWRLVTSALVHVDLGHLATNAAGLAVLGALGERRVGAWRWGAWAAWGAVAGGLGASAVGVVRSCGASAIGSAWLAGLWWLAREAGRRDPSPDNRLRARLLGWVLAVHLLLPMFLPRIDVAAHVGGVAAGLVLATRPTPGWLDRISVGAALLATVFGLAHSAAALIARP